MERGFSDWQGTPYSGVRLPIERSFGQYNFTSIVQSRAYAYDDIKQWRVIMARILGWYDDNRHELKSDPGLLSAEDEQAEKGRVCWRARGFGRLTFSGAFSSHSTLQLQELEDEISILRRALIATAERMSLDDLTSAYLDAPIHVDKGKGAPFWQPGTDWEAGYLLAILGRLTKSYDELRDTLQQDTGVAMHMTMFQRIQAARKKILARILQAGRVVADTPDDLPKVRTVKAPPYAENNVVAPTADVLKLVMLTTYPLQHTTDTALVQEILSAHESIWSTDLKTCDDRIGYELLTAVDGIIGDVTAVLVRRGIVEPWRLDFVRDYNDSIRSRFIYAPGFKPSTPVVTLLMDGGVKSGDRYTTMKDMIAVHLRNELLKKAMARHGVKADYICWGDDVIWYGHDPRARATYEAVLKEGVAQTHWKEEIDVEPSFLMLRGRGGYGYFMRQLTRKVNREPHEEADNVVGAALSLKASYEKLTGPFGVEHPWKHRWWEACSLVPKLAAAIPLAQQLSVSELGALYMSTLPQRTMSVARSEIAMDYDVRESGGVIKSTRLGIDMVAKPTERMLLELSRSMSPDDVRMLIRRRNSVTNRPMVSKNKPNRSRGSASSASAAAAKHY